MEQERHSLRLGLTVIVCAMIFRLLSGNVLEPVVDFLTKPETAAFLLYLETGRVARPLPPDTVESTAPTAQTQPTEPSSVVEEAPFFQAEDAGLVSVTNQCGYEADVQAMLLTDLRWDLTRDEPSVLIVHSHATESYTKTGGDRYEESSNYRTLDNGYNMVSIGDRVAQILEAGGITVIHDRSLHDYPSYNDAYDNSRTSVEDYLAQYPSIRLVLDLHRDAAGTADNQYRTEAAVDGQPCAQLMMVVGTDASGLYHPDWAENMALAIKLTALLERNWEGVTRPISFRSQRFNQDLSTGAMLIEVGAAGNTHQEALLAAEVLAKGILALSRGTATADSAS